jgi:hypothetical protein
VCIIKYYWDDQVKDVMGMACSMHGRMRTANKILVRKPEGKRPLRRPRHRWEYNIRMDLREVCWKGVDLHTSGLG